ncbi:OmpA family protein [uncultured Pontibacter sp.]|uniref:OmpA family protein n=1 Tax=uncultured Pontibacter sp. TaxID=453356 RepID=UPI00260BDAAB|nr:OmpA family protein [uncultured Pontibacter sp.]
MKYFVSICLLLLSCHLAVAQHDIYRWQFGGYTGIANYQNDKNSTTDYFKPNSNLLYRLQLTRHLGNNFGLELAYSYGDVRGLDQLDNRFTTDVRTASLRGIFYTDNGWLLNTSAIVSPYFFAGYGLGIFETSAGNFNEESRYVPLIPFGVGLKFRISEQWQVSLQSEAVYPRERHLEGADLEQNSRNSTFVHTGITVGYSFGFRKSEFRAAQFYAGNVELLQSVEGRPQPNLLQIITKLEPRDVRMPVQQDTTAFAEPDLQKRPVLRHVDTLETTRTAIEIDTTQALKPGEVEKVPLEKTDIQDTTMLPAAADTARLAAKPDSVVVPERVVEPKQAVVREQVVTREQVVEPDSVVQQKQTRAVTKEQQQELVERRDEPVIRRDYERDERRTYYTPAQRDQRIAQLQKEQQRLAAANAEISRKQRMLDSLQTNQLTDEYEALTDPNMVSFLSQQAALNDSVLLRLQQYEQELTLSQPASAPGTERAGPVAPTPRALAVFFPINSHRVPVQSLTDINQLLTALENNPQLQVRLTGYASQSGSAAYNMELSRKRAESLMNILIQQGISRERFSLMYMGSEKSSKEENRMDRKVEVMLTE